jgi:serine O-acetyltransferase
MEINNGFIEFDKTVKMLSLPSEHDFMNYRSMNEKPMPSIESLKEILERLKKVIFPGFGGYAEISPNSIPYFIGANLDMIYRLLNEQIKRGFCMNCLDSESICDKCEEKAKIISKEFIGILPKIKDLLAKDVIAAYYGDPAAKNYAEVIFCYPSIIALTHQRIAHELYKLDVPLIPRIITEIAHSITGIDIHPAAKIGEYFFIDHGTGVVIGETCEIGNNVRIYQGVTLGAKSFPLDDTGKPIKNIPRHPKVEDDVIIYANATILGRITIKKGAIVGANSWITEDVYPK